MSEAETKFIKQFLNAINADAVSMKLSEIVKNAVKANEQLITEDVNKKFSELMTAITLLRDELKQRDAAIADLNSANTKLIAENNGLKLRINELELASRRDNLTFTGFTLPYADVATSNADSTTTSERIVEKVTKLCTDTLGVPVTAGDISAAYPIFKGAGNKPSVVLVKFVRQSLRDKVYFSRKKLASETDDAKVYINEDLPMEARQLLGTLRSLVKAHSLAGAWSKFGKVYAKKLDTTIMQVKKLSDLNL